MISLDLSTSDRLPILMEMIGALSRATDPRDVLMAYATGAQNLQPTDGYLSISTRGLSAGEYRITRLIPDWNSREALLRSDPWSAPPPVLRGGFFGELIRSAYPQVIHNFFLRNDPIVGSSLAEFGSLLALPLFDDGEPRNWAISLKKDPTGFTIEDLEESVLRGNLIGTSVRNVLTAKKLQVANNAVRREVEQIANIQRSLLPERVPDIDGLEIATHYEVHDLAGGDYYDFLPNPADTWDGVRAIIVADASGHGPAAAVVMAMLQTILHTYPGKPDSAGEVLTYVNRHMARKAIAGSFVTAILLLWDPRDGSVRYARAGHPPAIRKQPGPGGAVMHYDEVGGLPLGIMPDETYEEGCIPLERGESIVLYTDGISEARMPGGEMFTVSGIEASLDQCSGMPGCVIESVTNALNSAGAKSDDDQTIVVLRRT